MFVKAIRHVMTLLLLAGPLSPVASAKEVRYKDYPIEVKEGDRLVLSALRANVRVQSATGGAARGAVIHVRKAVGDRASADDQARYEALSFNVRREGSAIVVEAKGADKVSEGKNPIGPWIRPSAPELLVEIDAPPVPIEILLHDGQVNVFNFHQAVTVNLVSGAIKTVGTEGLLRLNLQAGQIAIDKHRGRVEIDSYGAKLSVQDLDGDLDLANFAGESNITRARGNIDLKAHLGAVTIAKSSGSFDFLAGKGPVTLADFEGPVRGSTDQGPVSIGVGGDADVHVESNQGTVTVKLPSDSGAFVRMQSEEGVLQPPDAIKAASGRSKLVSGRLPGGGPTGTVAVKSKSGTLRVRL